MRMQCHDLGRTGFAAFPFHSQSTGSIIAEETFFGERAAAHIGGEVAKGGDSFSDGLEVDIPLLARTKCFACLRSQRGKDLGMLFLEGRIDPAAETSCQRAVLNEEFPFWRMFESKVFIVEDDGWHDTVDMRMMLDLASPTLEDGENSEPSAFVFGGDHILEGCSALADHQIVEDSGVGQTEIAQRVGQSEGDHEVGNGKQFGLLLRGPDLLVECSALGAAAVIAAVIGIVIPAVAAATVESSTHHGGTTRQDASHRPVMSSAQFGAMGVGIALPVLSEHIAEGDCHRSDGEGLPQGATGIRGGSSSSSGPLSLALFGPGRCDWFCLVFRDFGFSCRGIMERVSSAMRACSSLISVKCR